MTRPASSQTIVSEVFYFCNWQPTLPSRFYFELEKRLLLCRFLGRLDGGCSEALGRQASEKRQGTKSRDVEWTRLQQALWRFDCGGEDCGCSPGLAERLLGPDAGRLWHG